jgi:hypothetical protein
MSTNDVKTPIKHLSLNRQTVKNLKVRTSVQTGRSNGVAGTNVASCHSVGVSLGG